MEILNSVYICILFLRKNLLICTALLFLSITNFLCVLQYMSTVPLHLVFYHHDMTSDSSCLRKQGDGLPSGDSENHTDGTIFFVETSCKGGIDSRQACAVESAARAHPNRVVVLMFAGPVTNVSLRSGIFDILQSTYNVQIRRIHLDKYPKGSPVEALCAGDHVIKGKHPVEHMSDVLRILSLYKYGGLYLDLDVVVTKPFDSLPRNFVVREASDAIGSAILAFSKDTIGSKFASLCMNELATNYNGDLWAHNGPALMSRVLNKICTTSTVLDMSNKTCNGFHVLDTKYFYPIHYSDKMQYFQPGVISPEPYAHHIWNKLTHQFKVSKDSLYANIARNFCPKIYELYTDEFGS